MKYLIPALIILLYSCSATKRCEHHLAKAKQLGCLIAHTDTVNRYIYIKGDTIHEIVKVGIDSAALDSFLNTIKDTCISKEIIKTFPKFIPCKAKPYHKDTTNYKLDIILINGELDVKIIIKPKKVEIKEVTKYNEVTKIIKYIPWYIYVLIGSLIFLLILSLWHRK